MKHIVMNRIKIILAVMSLTLLLTFVTNKVSAQCSTKQPITQGIIKIIREMPSRDTLQWSVNQSICNFKFLGLHVHYEVKFNGEKILPKPISKAIIHSFRYICSTSTK
jgi:hypothetical protein